MIARWDDESKTAVTVSFRIPWVAIQAVLPDLPKSLYPETHDALTAALGRSYPATDICLPEPIARDFLQWLKAAAYRRTKDGSPHARLLVEAADTLEFEITRLADE